MSETLPDSSTSDLPAEVSRATAYRYFPSQAALVQAVVDEALGPILDSLSLSKSATIDPTLSVGERVTEPGTFDTIDELAPGASATFTDSVPVELLATSG